MKKETKHIFIVGNSRSGTTMLSNIFNNYSKTLVFKELHFYNRLTKSISRTEILSESLAVKIYSKLIASNILEPWNSHKSKQFEITARKHIKLQQNYMKGDVFRLFLENELKKNNRDITVEQTPKNAYHIIDINYDFKDFKLVHIYRDPRATLISQKNKWRRYKIGGKANIFEIIRLYFNYNPIIISYIYKKTIEQVNKDKLKIDKKNFIEIKYENVLKDPECTIKNLFNDLNMTYSNKLINIGHSSSSFVSKKTERKGIDSTRSENWRQRINSAELFICQIINKKHLDSLCYEKIKVFPNLVSLIGYFIILPIQAIIIGCLNYRLLKSNIISVLKSRNKKNS